MSKPYTENELSEQLVGERTWRLKEISDLKTVIVRADRVAQRVLLRSLVTICYAHWEGYVRFAAQKYMEHIALRKFKYEKIDRQFLKNHFLPRIASIQNGKSTLEERCKLVDDILNSSELTFKRSNRELVSTRSNLNSSVLADICLVCGIPFSMFSAQTDFIDKILLSRRNAIAHGEDTFVAFGDMDDMCQITIGLMRTFGDAVENRVVLGTYMAA